MSGGIAIDLRPLRESRPLRLLWLGGTATALGNRLTTVAMAWQVQQLTGSPGKVGLLGLCAGIPYLLFSMLGGAFADKLDRRRILVGSGTFGVVTSVLLFANAASSRPQVWVIFVLATVRACQGALASPARMSLAPLLLRAELIPAAAALDQVAFNLSFVGGPGLAGLLIAGPGVRWAYAVDAAGALGGLTAAILAGPLPRMGSAGGHLAAIAEGLRFLRHRGELQASFLADVIAMIFGFPSALLPAVVVARYHDDPKVLGVLFAAVPLGALLASLTSGWTARIHRHGIGVVLSITVWGAAIAAFAFTAPLWASVAALAVAGMADSISGVFRMSILQTGTPPEMIGRVMGVGMAVWAAGPPLGDVEAGLMAELFSVDASIFIGGVASMIGVWLLAFAWPSFRRYDVLTRRAELAAAKAADGR